MLHMISLCKIFFSFLCEMFGHASPAVSRRHSQLSSWRSWICCHTLVFVSLSLSFPPSLPLSRTAPLAVPRPPVDVPSSGWRGVDGPQLIPPLLREQSWALHPHQAFLLFCLALGEWYLWPLTSDLFLPAHSLISLVSILPSLTFFHSSCNVKRSDWPRDLVRGSHWKSIWTSVLVCVHVLLTVSCLKSAFEFFFLFLYFRIIKRFTSLEFTKLLFYSK